MVRRVRRMLLGDIGRVCKISAQAWRQSTYADIQPDVPVFSAFLKDSILGQHALAIVAEVDGEVQGVLIGHIYPWYFSSKSFATERFFLVTKAGEGMGARLLFRFMAWAKGHSNVNIIHLIASAGMPQQERVEKLYGRLGKRVGSVFHIEV